MGKRGATSRSLDSCIYAVIAILKRRHPPGEVVSRAEGALDDLYNASQEDLSARPDGGALRALAPFLRGVSAGAAQAVLQAIDAMTSGVSTERQIQISMEDEVMKGLASCMRSSNAQTALDAVRALRRISYSNQAALHVVRRRPEVLPTLVTHLQAGVAGWGSASAAASGSGSSSSIKETTEEAMTLAWNLVSAIAEGAGTEDDDEASPDYLDPAVLFVIPGFIPAVLALLDHPNPVVASDAVAAVGVLANVPGSLEQLGCEVMRRGVAGLLLRSSEALIKQYACHRPSGVVQGLPPIHVDAQHKPWLEALLRVCSLVQKLTTRAVAAGLVIGPALYWSGVAMSMAKALREMVLAFVGFPAFLNPDDGAEICLSTASFKLLAVLLPEVKLAPGGLGALDDPATGSRLMRDFEIELERQEQQQKQKQQQEQQQEQQQQQQARREGAGAVQPRGSVDPAQRSGPPACAVCRRTSGDGAVLRRCKGCGRLTGVRYCSQDCCREHWKHMGHRRQCEAAQKQLQQASAPAEARAPA